MALGVVRLRAVTCDVALLRLGPGARLPTPASKLTPSGEIAAQAAFDCADIAGDLASRSK